jgi:hypothetical protein
LLSRVDLSSLITPLTAVLTFGTVWVGVRGLYQDHLTDKGKLTRAGQRVVALMFLLGGLSFLLGWTDRELTDRKERADAAERARQMTVLQQVTGSLSRLQTGMNGSLTRQEQLYGIASRTLHASGLLQQETRENTNTVLRRVFAESNRISAERIAISVSFHCPPLGPYTEGPNILSATLTMSGPSGETMSLSTDQQLSLSNGLLFHGFREDLGPYESFPAWQAARISIRLSGWRPMERMLSLDEFVRMSPEDRQNADRVPEGYSCSTTALLLLNGRQVLQVVGPFRSGGGEDHFVAEFNNLRVDSNRIPRL